MIYGEWGVGNGEWGVGAEWGVGNGDINVTSRKMSNLTTDNQQENLEDYEGSDKWGENTLRTLRPFEPQRSQGFSSEAWY